MGDAGARTARSDRVSWPLFHCRPFSTVQRSIACSFHFSSFAVHSAYVFFHEINLP